ncbi:MAG: DUF2089 domain-containing protein [Spirochaetales bacterium]|nr:DUF2089 domain-containing protein [Spirochaetales bacterium]
MMNRILHDCPVCGSSLMVRVLECTKCGTRIEGTFDTPHNRILSLSEKDIEFVELFVRLRGNIKEMEKALGVSYPTVRGRLDSVISNLGFQTKRGPSKERRKEVIDQLEAGKITAEEAARLLQEEEVDE